MKREEAVQHLSELLRQTFESGRVDKGMSVYASNNQRNEVQFRLMKLVAALQHADSPDSLYDQIIADVNLSHAMGWMTDETYKKIETILGDM